MPSAFARFAEDDAAKFVDPTLFGVAATYTPAGQPTPEESFSIHVTFSDPTLEALDNPVAQDTEPTALARAEDVPNPRRGDRLLIAGTLYTVRGFQPDSFGHVLLTLATEDGLTQPGDVLNLATSYAGSGLAVGLNWDPDPAADEVAKRSAIQVWRQDMDANTAAVLIATLGAMASGYNDTAPAPAEYRYEIICLGPGGRSPGAFLDIDVNA